MVQFKERVDPPEMPGGMRIDAEGLEWLRQLFGFGVAGSTTAPSRGTGATRVAAGLSMLVLLPDRGRSFLRPLAQEGPLRATVETKELRLSGDLYARPSRRRSGRVGAPGEPPWFARSRYRSYLRGVEICGLRIVFDNIRFTGTHWVSLPSLVLELGEMPEPPPPGQALVIEGQYTRGSTTNPSETGFFRLEAIGSTLRRAFVEIDKVAAVSWPEPPDESRTIESAFRDAAWTVEVACDCPEITDGSSSGPASRDFLNTNADRFRRGLPETSWHYYVQCQRFVNDCRTFGMQHGSGGSAKNPARQDVAVAAHARLPPPFDTELENQPLYYLRTVVHELGRAVGFNGNEVSGCGFMRDTRSVVGDCSEPTWSFTPEQIHALEHRPDAWIRPHFAVTSSSFELPPWLKRLLQKIVERARDTKLKIQQTLRDALR